MTENIKARLLIVDDELNTCRVLKRAFELMGYQADSAQSAQQAFSLLEERTYDLMTLDLRMPEIEGVQVMRVVHEKYPNLLVIILTAHASLSSAIAAVKAGATDYLLKPQKIPEIQNAVEKALAHRQSQKQRKQLLAVMSEALQALQLEEGSSGQIISEGSSQQIELNEGRIQLDLEKRLFILQRGPGMEQIRIELTAYESALLAYLMRHPNQVHSNRDLALKALGYAHIEEVEARSIIRPHITRLRRKVEIEPTHPQLIKNIRSKGYILVT